MRLMVIYGEGEGDQDGRLPTGCDLRDGGRACPAEEEIGLTVCRGHVHDERRNFSRKTPFPVGIRNRFPVALPRLVDETEPILQVQQVIQGLSDNSVDRARPLAAAKEQMSDSLPP